MNKEHLQAKQTLKACLAGPSFSAPSPPHDYDRCLLHLKQHTLHP